MVFTPADADFVINRPPTAAKDQDVCAAIDKCLEQSSKGLAYPLTLTCEHVSRRCKKTTSQSGILDVLRRYYTRDWLIVAPIRDTPVSVFRFYKPTSSGFFYDSNTHYVMETCYDDETN